MSYRTVANHRSMALDARRNEAYAQALRAAIDPTSVVLDVGAGTGILGLMAARLGAKRVYLVEPDDILSVAAEIADANGLSEIVRCVQARMEDAVLPEPVDVIVSAMTGNFLLTEDLLATLFHARDTVLKPGGRLIPNAATMEVVPVMAPAFHDQEIARWSIAQQGVNLSSARGDAANTVFYRREDLRGAEWLAEPLVLRTFDFHTDDYRGVHLEGVYDITRSGTCHGWLGWFSIELGGRWLSTSPREPELHWSPAFLPIDPPLLVERGDRVSFALDRAPFGDWTWRVQSRSGDRVHSTVLSGSLSSSTLKKVRASFAPALNAEGGTLLKILSLCDGAATVDVIVDRVQAELPGRFHTRSAAVAAVYRALRPYTT